MKRLLYRLRGLLGLGSFGAAAGGLFGVIWSLVEGMLLSPGVRLPLIFYVIGWALIGATTTVGFGLLLTTTSGRRRLEDVSPWRARALGAVAGAVGPLLVQTWLGGPLPPSITLLIAAVGGTLGAGLGSGLISVAKSAESEREIVQGDSSLMLEEGTQPGGSTI